MNKIMKFHELNNREEYSKKLFNSLIKLDKLVQAKPDDLATIDSIPFMFEMPKDFRAIKGYKLFHKLSKIEHSIWSKHNYPDAKNGDDFNDKMYCDQLDYLYKCYDRAKEKYGDLSHYYFLPFSNGDFRFSVEDKDFKAMSPLTNYQLYCVLCLFMDNQSNYSPANTDLLFFNGNLSIHLGARGKKEYILRAFNLNVLYGMSLFGNWYDNFYRIMNLRLPDGKSESAKVNKLI